jgi:flagellar protein FliO/FliZ
MRLSLVLVFVVLAGVGPSLRAAAQAAAPEAPPATAPVEDRIIYPGASKDVAASPLTSSSGTRGLTTLLGVALLAGAGGWLLWKKRQEGPARREARLLAIDETRPLGNRQYLVVASYEGRKFLLGVCPGRIDLLSPLDENSRREPPLAG